MGRLLVRPAAETAPSTFHRLAREAAGSLPRRLDAGPDEAEQMHVSRDLQKIFVEGAPALPLFASPLWGVFNAGRFTGFPSRFHPYAGAAPALQSDTLQVLLELKPR